MKYQNWAVVRCPDTHEAVFVAAKGERVGYIFGHGEEWPNREDLPSITPRYTLRSIRRKYQPLGSGLTILGCQLLRNKVQPFKAA
jgi:hypothetical protein